MFVDFTIPGMLPRPVLAGVYKITFDHKFYIGGCTNLHSRFKKWKSMLTNGQFKNFQIKEAYLVCTHVKMEIIEIVENIDLLDTRETFHIQSYWGSPLLLNRSPQARVNTGMKWTDEQVEIMRNRTGISVGKFTKDGTLLKVYGSVAEAIDENSMRKTEIHRVFRYAGRSSKGFVYKRLDQAGIPIEAPIFPVKQRHERKKRRPLTKQAKENVLAALKKRYENDDFVRPVHAKCIIKYNLNGEEICRYPSIQSAAKAHNGEPRNLKRAIKNSPRSFYKGFIFKYA